MVQSSFLENITASIQDNLLFFSTSIKLESQKCLLVLAILLKHMPSYQIQLLTTTRGVFCDPIILTCPSFSCHTQK